MPMIDEKPALTYSEAVTLAQQLAEPNTVPAQVSLALSKYDTGNVLAAVPPEKRKFFAAGVLLGAVAPHEQAALALELRRLALL